MIKWKFKDKSEQITRTSLKAKAIIGVVLCAILISILQLMTGSKKICNTTIWLLFYGTEAV